MSDNRTLREKLKEIIEIVRMVIAFELIGLTLKLCPEPYKSEFAVCVLPALTSWKDRGERELRQAEARRSARQ